MKKWIKVCLVCIMTITLFGCSKPKEFEQVQVKVDEVHDMMEKQEDFILLVERENCPFCEELQDFIKESKQEHNDIKIYTLDTTNFKFKKEDGKLTSETEEGKSFLQMFPNFLYTPSIYTILSGEAVEVGVGFDAATQQISIWDVDSVIDFDRADTKNVWLYIEEAI